MLNKSDKRYCISLVDTSPLCKRCDLFHRPHEGDAAGSEIGVRNVNLLTDATYQDSM